MNFFYFRFFFMFFIVLILTMFPFPVGYEMLRPFWGLLLVLYVQFKLPDTLSYFWVIALSLFLDVLGLVPLGEHLFAFSLVMGLASSRARRFRFFSSIQQLIWVFFLAFIYTSALVVIDYFCGHPVMFIRFLVPPLVTMIAWPVFSSWVEMSIFRVKAR